MRRGIYQGVRVRIVPSHITSTPSTIVSSGGMLVYVVNSEALPNAQRKSPRPFLRDEG